MENLNYSLACGIMSASGFTLAYYQHLAFNQRKKASEKAKRVYDDTSTPLAIAYIEELKDKWKIAPVIFNSYFSFFAGWLIVVIGFVFNLFKNDFISSIFTVVEAYICFRFLSMLINWQIQLVSFFAFIVSFIWIVILWFEH